MKNKYNNLARNQKGISLIALTTTVIVLAILTSIVVFNAKDNVEIREYKKLENDIEILQNKVDMYYLKNDELPIVKKDSNLINYSGKNNYKSQKQSNDNDNYYIIDLDYIGGVTLNFGNGFYNINAEKNNCNDITDLYIINEQSHRIYYVAGVTANGKTYYTIGTDSKITMN